MHESLGICCQDNVIFQILGGMEEGGGLTILSNIVDNIDMFINKLFEIDFEINVSDKSFIEEQRFEAIIASL